MALAERQELVTTFGDALRNHNGDHLKHPLILKRSEQAQILQSTIELKKSDPRVADLMSRFPQLVPLDVDQGLALTPFDEFDDVEIDVPPEELIEGWRRQREYILSLANHPDRIKAMRKLEARGFVPPEKIEGVIDKILKRGVIPQLPDLAHNADVLDGHHNNPQVHRTDIFRDGPFSFVGQRVRSFVGLGAMPDVNGSVLMLETAAKMHMIAQVPEVGVFSDPKKQAQLAKAVLERLTIDDPLLEGRSLGEKRFIVDHWRSNVVGVLEVDKEKALVRLQQLAKMGVTSFRPYGHSVGTDIVDTIQAIGKTFGDAFEIFASQITNVEIAKKCEEAGADAIIIGVGSGGRCTTADQAQLAPSNAALAWRLRGEVEIPVIGEGGAVDEPVISALVGMSGVYGSGSIGGGTFEAPGGMFFFKRNGNYLKPYGGEASERTKFLGGRVDPTGEPIFPEGIQDFKALTFRKESMTRKVLDIWNRLVLGAVILGVNEGAYTISAIQNLEPSPLWEKSPTTQRLQETH